MLPKLSLTDGNDLNPQSDANWATPWGAPGYVPPLLGGGFVSQVVS
jgi:hypothetical protein